MQHLLERARRGGVPNRRESHGRGSRRGSRAALWRALEHGDICRRDSAVRSRGGTRTRRQPRPGVQRRDCTRRHAGGLRSALTLPGGVRAISRGFLLGRSLARHRGLVATRAPSAISRPELAGATRASKSPTAPVTPTRCLRPGTAYRRRCRLARQPAATMRGSRRSSRASGRRSRAPAGSSHNFLPSTTCTCRMPKRTSASPLRAAPAARLKRELIAHLRVPAETSGSPKAAQRRTAWVGVVDAVSNRRAACRGAGASGPCWGTGRAICSAAPSARILRHSGRARQPLRRAGANVSRLRRRHEKFRSTRQRRCGSCRRGYRRCARLRSAAGNGGPRGASPPQPTCRATLLSHPRTPLAARLATQTAWAAASVFPARNRSSGYSQAYLADNRRCALDQRPRSKPWPLKRSPTDYAPSGATGLNPPRLRTLDPLPNRRSTAVTRTARSATCRANRNSPVCDRPFQRHALPGGIPEVTIARLPHSVRVRSRPSLRKRRTLA